MQANVDNDECPVQTTTYILDQYYVLNAVERKNERQTKQFKPKLLNQKVIKVNGQTYGRIMANSILLPYREGEWGQQRHWVKITKAAPSALV